MTKKSICIRLEGGLAVTPVAFLVQEASKYDSTIFIQVEGKKVNAKSMMGMMSLGLNEGEELEVVADGVDEKEAVAGIEAFLSGK